MPQPPAAPARADELDPELVSLKRKRGVGPLLAISVLVLCGWTLIKLRHDLTFAAAAHTPADLGDAAALYARGETVPDNRYVALRARLDASAPGRLHGKQDYGHRLVPVLGTSRRLWLHVVDDPFDRAPVYDVDYRGRTRRIQDLAFADELRKFVASLPPMPRWIAAAELAKGGAPVDVHGDALTLTPDTAVAVDERVAGVALVTLYANDRIKDEAGARAALTAAGLPPTAGPIDPADKRWTYEVAAPEGTRAVRAQLGKAALWAALASDSVRDKVIHHAGTWKDVRVDAAAGTVTLGEARVPLGNVSTLVAFVSPDLPADAEILLVDDAPAAYWYMFPLAAVLALVSVLMVWGLVRVLRGDAPPPAPLVIKPPDAPVGDAPEPPAA